MKQITKLTKRFWNTDGKKEYVRKPRCKITSHVEINKWRNLPASKSLHLRIWYMGRYVSMDSDKLLALAKYVQTLHKDKLWEDLK